jgi:hypothetical protein
MYYLFIILVIVVLYKLYNVKEGFYSSINPCFDKKTPYVKFEDTYACFDNKDKVEDTLSAFYGKEKNCFIDPKDTTMIFYDVNGNVTDSIKEKTNKICKPYKVNIS